MRTRTAAIILAGLIASACGTSGTDSLEFDPPHVKNALRLEFYFGDEGLPEDYLLAEPRGLAVGDNGDILVTDEYHIKIYDAQGNPRERLGGQGQGPGEFQESQQLFFGPNRYLSAGNGFSQFNLYGPDLTYLSLYNGGADDDLRDYLREQELTFNYVKGYCPLDESRRILTIFGRKRDLPGKFPVFRHLVYSDGDTLKELVKHHSLADVLNDRGGSTSSAYLGDFHWGLLEGGDRIVHAQTHQTIKGKDRSALYSLNILDVHNGSTQEIQVEYKPMALPETLRQLKTQHFQEINLTIEPPPVLQALLDETRFLPAFEAMRTDGDLIFLFKFNILNEELERSIEEAEMQGEEPPVGIYSRFEPYQVDIVSVSSGRLIAKAEFSCVPDVIKDGRAYRLKTSADAFPKVGCYRIDPAVYAGSRTPE